MKVSDYVVAKLYEAGVDKVFFVSGGGAMHLNNSLGSNSMVEGVCMLHEQGAAIAAEAYARARDGLGCCLVTSGPGATNAITGLVGAYIDSIPVIFISGQAKIADLRQDSGVRQFGIQEVDILSMVKSYTKYAVQLTDLDSVRYEMEKAIAIALSGRPGPVWLDIPLDIQASQIDESSQREFKAENKVLQPYREDIDATIQELNKAERPIFIIGHGIRLSHSIAEMRKLYEYVGIPVLTTWNGVDLIEDTHPLFFGRPGAVGQRAANFIQQKADCVITIGTRLCLLNSGYNFGNFLKNAKHIMVDIDEAEMNKKSLHPYKKIHCDAKAFINALWIRKNEINLNQRTNWFDWCRRITERYPVFIKEQSPREGYVSNYNLVSEISNQMHNDDLYQFTSSGTTVDIAMKVFKIKWGQRAFLTKGLAAMGYDIPACVGSAMGSGRRVVCVTGDGSACMNMQELEVIKRYSLPIKLFVSDNAGYSMIYQSQSNNFQSLTGCDRDSGLTLPDMGRIAEAFGIHSVYINSEDDLSEQIAYVLDFNGPVVCIVKTDITQKILPKQTNYMMKNGQIASRPLEDMTPLLDRSELLEIMGNSNDYM